MDGTRHYAYRSCSCSGSSSILVIGGLTGIMLGSVPLDLQVHDTLLRRRAPALCADRRRRVSAACGDLLLVPEVHRTHADDRLGKWHFWLFFIGFN